MHNCLAMLAKLLLPTCATPPLHISHNNNDLLQKYAYLKYFGSPYVAKLNCAAIVFL